MWRPFAHNFAQHAYENFIKKYDRADSAPLRMTRETITGEKMKKNKSVEGISEEAEKRIEDFELLKKRVIQQRELIKNTDTHLKKHDEVRLRIIREGLRKEREKKKAEMIRIRGFSSSKPTRISRTANQANSFSGRTTRTPNSNIFGLTEPIAIRRANNNKTPILGIRMKLAALPRETFPTIRKTQKMQYNLRSNL